MIDLSRANAYLIAMALREIIILPDKRLRQVCEPVKTVNDRVRALMDDMAETMYEAPGVGLAASQIAVMKRVVVVDASRGDEDEERVQNPMFFANPEITWVSDEMAEYEEGCLSIPEFYEPVERPAMCRVVFLDYDGNPQEMECDGLMATVVQHEIDHLNGVLFIDHISKLKRDMIVKKFSKAKKRESAA